MTQAASIESLAQIRKRLGSPKNTNEIHKKRLSPLDTLALFCTQKVGTMGFFFIIFGWTVLWLGWNMLAPVKLRFDPYPAFVLWLFISNLIQIHLMPLIMVGQNIQGSHAELRALHDYETDVKAEREIEAILLHMEQQQQVMLEILRKIERLEKQ